MERLMAKTQRLQTRILETKSGGRVIRSAEGTRSVRRGASDASIAASAGRVITPPLPRQKSAQSATARS
jgi:hypothetical protein